mmetsp:Transcript_33326/g.76938  ORF Transcript_33326/g.76938 Transcript_33326/m.76938 type:complete len:175 (-) Transcript_33326:180-704(-)
MLPIPQRDKFNRITSASVGLPPVEVEEGPTAKAASNHPLYHYNVLKAMKSILGVCYRSKCISYLYLPADATKLVEGLICFLSNSDRYKPRAVQMSAMLLLEVIRGPSDGTGNGITRTVCNIAMRRCRELEGVGLLNTISDKSEKFSSRRFASSRYRVYADQDIRLKPTSQDSVG